MAILERDAYLEILNDLLGEAGRGRGRLVLVKGEAGIGKSTLVEAFASGQSDRVRWGNCDPVFPPRPFAPLLDIAERVDTELRAALTASDPHHVFTAVINTLRADGGPWVMVFEDLQWADEATLELIQVIGRRIAQMPALLVGTFRDDDVGPEHALSAALGDVPSASRVSIDLPSLSMSAVEALASGTAIDPVALHRATSGNPFFVTEVVAAGGSAVPATVREAVLARAKRLTPAALQVMRAASILGPRCDVDVLTLVAEAEPADIEECVVRGLLHRDGSTVEFNHEISQRAMAQSVSASERTALHRRALGTLRHRSAAVEPAELARHAVEAGDAEAVMQFARMAGATASALGAHRAARTHFGNALRFAQDLGDRDRAALLADYAHECMVIDEPDKAASVQEEAVRCWRQAGDIDAAGAALCDLAEYLLWCGEGERGKEVATQAVMLLETAAPGLNLARAYARLAQLLMVAGQDVEAIGWGEKSVALAERLGAEGVVVHALNTVGTARMSMGLDHGLPMLEESLRRARTARLHEDVARALGNLIASAFENKRHDLTDRYREEAISFAAERDLDLKARCIIGDLGKVLVEEGRWDEATAQAQEVIDRGWFRGRQESLLVLGRVAARRGDAEAASMWLDRALYELDAEVWGKGRYEVRAARAEAAWLKGDVRLAAVEVEAGLETIDEDRSPWLVGEYAFWARRVGIDWEPPPGRVSEPYALHLAGHPAKAAAAWASLGCPYEEAQALADSDEPSDLQRALDSFQSLGARPLAARTVERLRTMGARRISRGPRASTRSNPGGLSNREVDVLVLLAEGLRNTEIAERLVVSTRTVDHHVSALLMKLGAENRSEAARKAVELGLAK